MTQDLRLTECITDAKCDRSAAPGAQHDPDSYVHVVDRRSDGVVIRAPSSTSPAPHSATSSS